ncbi:hypothetical protein [Chitinophaga sancti]|uniref:HNH endonuclease n=1 Tax=Chitinophaga sancti TaxID=1004 RepID=A0A1K1RWZ4_9BACT|nr:hypothetical protein [Chitinophaga sancti]WQD63988.1 hypothetical protein U0033_06230 [Chitinophaga sancti]WQG90388.1 hypothetical protein SR876_02690 [Chitinophaga sancti]SFW76348.1 hypothetical protein SAMN05661012_04336 [Chitinophaga sancti]
MIKIETHNLDQVAQEYFDQVKFKCLERARFYKKVFNFLYGSGTLNALQNDTLHGKTKKRIANFLLEHNKMKTLAHFGNLVPANVYQWVNDHEQTIFGLLEFLDNVDNLRQLILIHAINSYDADSDVQSTFNINYGQHQNTIFPIINDIIDYAFFDDFAYNIASSVGINSCPYCNRIYINTVIDKNGKHIIRPTFDHFFPQSKHPFLALSFFNLVPSCYYCNANLKTATIITHQTHLHPYLEGFDNGCSFRVVISGLHPNISDPRNYKIVLQSDIPSYSPKYRKIFGTRNSDGTHNLKEGNTNLFKLEDIYNSHTDIVGELVLKADRYSKGQSKALFSLFDLLGTNKTEFYQYYFGNYYHENLFHKRPMAKLTKDVLQQVLQSFF